MTAMNDVHILIVEDDDVDVMAIKRMLVNVDREIAFSVAYNGEEAIDFLRKLHRESTEHKHLIVLLDLNMPRMTGHEFLTVIRNDPELRKTIVFVLTTSTDERDMEKSYEKHVSGYIPKDRLNEDNLRQLIENYLSLVMLPGI